MDVVDVDGLVTGLAEHSYLADDDLATAMFLALRMERPILLEGEAGVGKTAIAHVMAALLETDLIRLQCHEGLDLAQAAYDWDHARQLLHLRAAEATGEAAAAGATELRDGLYGGDFLIRRPLLHAIDHGGDPPVLLIDEVDRADDEFEAFLLEILSEYAITIPELGTFSTDQPPLVILTSNRTRDLHDALKRRCLYHWVEHPSRERETAIIRLRVPQASATIAQQVADVAATLREHGLYKPPGIAETIDWAHALTVMGATELDPRLAEVTLGALLKYREDTERVVGHGVAAMLEASFGRR
ncbi:AAA family ATPase [Euzebya tangerina]|uniref:AAA family ATPase n=1 Tax=Euzebya tangerina TaxID=591198 RepID=UPI000E3243F0|nr:MoxR family ATPase [Euzebya tangerina]